MTETLNKTAPKVYYKDAGFFISESKARAPRKTYRVDKIEKVSLRRDPFFISLTMSIFAFLFVANFGRQGTILPTAILSTFIIMTVFLRHFGMLYITTKAISELAFVGVYDRLENVRDAIEKSMHKDEADGGMVAGDDDDD